MQIWTVALLQTRAWEQGYLFFGHGSAVEEQIGMGHPVLPLSDLCVPNPETHLWHIQCAYRTYQASAHSLTNALTSLELIILLLYGPQMRGD